MNVDVEQQQQQQNALNPAYVKNNTPINTPNVIPVAGQGPLTLEAPYQRPINQAQPDSVIPCYRTTDQCV